MSGEWVRRTERGTPLAVRAMIWISRRVGRSAARILLGPITAYFLLTSARERRTSREFLARALGREPRRLDVARNFWCFATTLLDRVYLLSGQLHQFDIRFYGQNTIQDCLRAGKGCLAIGAHLGSFDVMRAIATTQEHVDLKVLMYPDHNRAITTVMHELDPRLADMVIPLGRVDTLLKARSCLEDGGVVGLLADRVVDGDKTTLCHFFGAETVFPAGPMLIASALKTPAVLFFGVYRGGNRYEIHFELLSDAITLRANARAEDVQRLMQKYASRLEHHARSAPYNWFNFYDFWEPASR